jgi:hypothetical protein
MSSDDVSLFDWWRTNPWYVLGVAPQASRMEVERKGQKLLDLLAVKSASAAAYETPLGTAERDEDAVRQALGLLRDPDQRILCELWAAVDLPAPDETLPVGEPEPWTGAPGAGWRASCPYRR